MKYSGKYRGKKSLNLFGMHKKEIFLDEIMFVGSVNRRIFKLQS